MRSTHPLAQVRFDPQAAVVLAHDVLGSQRRRVSMVFTVSGGNFARPFGPIAALLHVQDVKGPRQQHQGQGDHEGP